MLHVTTPNATAEWSRAQPRTTTTINSAASSRRGAHRGPDTASHIHTPTLLLIATSDPAAEGSCAPLPTMATVSALPSANAALPRTSLVQGPRVDRFKKENEKDGREQASSRSHTPCALLEKI
jgi:hypothetical protein